MADAPLGAVLVLAHGAGAGQRHPFMVVCARGLSARGIDVVTFDFPYMQQGRRVPDKAPALEACFQSAIEAVRRHTVLGGRRLFIGGKSMGGRIATHLGASGVVDLAGVVVLGYPLHPPGKRDQLRVAHLGSIATPMLVVQGSRDAFGTPSELAPVFERMAAPVALHVVEGGDHSLKVSGRPADDVFDEVLDRVRGWVKGVQSA